MFTISCLVNRMTWELALSELSPEIEHIFIFKFEFVFKKIFNVNNW